MRQRCGVADQCRVELHSLTLAISD